MSTLNERINTGVHSRTDRDNSKVFVWNNRFVKATYTNSTYDPIPLLEGTAMGRISGSQELTPLKSTATDGSQFPLGILKGDVNIAGGTSAIVNVCNEGDIVEGKVLLQSPDTLDTVIDGKSIRDRLASDTVGLQLITVDELTKFDN